MRQTNNDLQLSEQDLQYLQMGRAAMIPGFQRAITVLQEQLENMKQEMYRIQDTLERRAMPSARVMVDAQRLPAAAEPSKKQRSRSAGSYWKSLTKKQRSAEMRRRFEVRERNKQAREASAKPATKLHPRDKRHPDHKAWLAKMAAAARKRWSGYSSREKKNVVKAMLDGRKQRAVPQAILEKIA